MSSYIPVPLPHPDKPSSSMASNSINAINWSTPSTWPKWLVALAIGVPVSAIVFTTGFYTYRRWNGSSSGGKPKKPSRGTLTGSSQSGVESGRSSVNERSSSPGKPKTPAEQIQWMKNEGNRLFRAKKYSEAKKFYTQAIDLATTTGVAEDLHLSLQNRAACNEQLKLFKDVIVDCDAAIQINPQYAKAYSRRSRGHEKCGNTLDAFHDLVAASILSNFENQEFKERSEKMLNFMSTEMAREEMSRKTHSKREPKLSRAFIRQFGTGFSRDPLRSVLESLDNYDPEDPLRIALKALQSEDFEQVLKEAGEALAYPGANRHLARLLRGTVYFLLGNLKDASTDLLNVVSDQDSTLDEKSNARIKLACISLQETMSPDDVTSKLTKALHLDPTNPDIYFHRAQCFMIFGKFDECLEDFRKCQQYQSSGDTTCAFHIAHIQYRIRSNDNPMDPGPLETLENSIIPLDNPEGFVLLAQLYMERERFDKADHFFKRAIRPGNDPHNAVVYTQQALLEMVAHENREASGALLAKAIAVDQYYSAALELMMDLELQAGNMVAARSLYERILDLAKSEMEMVNVIQAYQLGVAGHTVYQKLGITEHGPIPIGIANPNNTL